MPLHLHAYRARQTLSSVFTNRTLKRPEGRAPAPERGVYAASPPRIPAASGISSVC